MSAESAPQVSGGSPLPGPEIYPGRGVSLQTQAAQPPVVIAEGGDVTLNFVNAEVREFVDTVLGKLLGVGYVIDPRVQGTVTLQTARPVPRSSVIGVIEDVLAMNGAALVQSGDVYKVIPLETAVSAPAILSSGAAPVRLDRGFSLHIISLRYASAAALREVVEPFIPPGRVLRVDADRNLFIFAGTGPEAADFTELVTIFDLDWMAGKSFGLFPLKFADPKDVATELAHVFGKGAAGLPAGIVDIVPIDRLSAVLVIAPQEALLREARTWVERLDRGVETDRRQLFVYYVQNGRATELADALGQAFAITAVGTAAADSGPRLAPGLTPIELSQPQATTVQESSTSADTSSPADFASPQTQYLAERGAGGLPVLGIGAPGSPGVGAEDTLRIVADARNNALLVYATPDEYRMIDAALKKLDIVPLQVLIEATIAEVTLNDSLKYGLEWFFDIGNSTITFNTSETGPTPTPTPNLILSQFPGFSYVFASEDVKLVLNALTQITDVKVISSPQLMVLDNEPARLQVGDQVPVAVRTSQSTDVTADAPIVSEIEYRDTGVILDIIPRVNASGLVVLDIIQEVSDVVPTVVNANTTTATQAQTPTISQRRIASTVAINSGETVVLGGLIRDSATNSVTGVPLLSEIPLLGNLFKTTTDTTRRTELLVLLTPRVVRDRHDARVVTDELRQRLRGLIPLTEKIQ